MGVNGSEAVVDRQRDDPQRIERCQKTNYRPQNAREAIHYEEWDTKRSVALKSVGEHLMILPP